MRILLVEDNEINAELAKIQLAELGHVVEHATSGESALDLFADSDFDLVLMDARMPGIDGFETTRRIRAAEREGPTPIVAVTADGRDVIGEARDSGMDAVLSKPFSPTDLAEILDRFA